MAEQGIDKTVDLTEPSSDVRGAMVCDYATFRTIYRLAARAAIRNKDRAIITTVKIIPADDSMEKLEHMAVANKVGASIAAVLRRDDVVTGFDTGQYLILLNNLTPSNGEIVLERLISKIQSEVGEGVIIQTDMQTISAYSEEKK